MILRSVRLVHFQGVPELHLCELPEHGIVDPPLPAGAGARVVCDALRFAFLGRAGGWAPVISDGKGFAHVEVTMLVHGGAPVSLFRGVDRRGAVQVSLREEDGARLTGGEAAVRARLEEFAGAPLERWEYATWIERPAAADDPLREAAAPRDPVRPAAAEPAAVPAADLGEPRERSERAVDALRRSLRAEVLKSSVDAHFTALSEFGARLRRERTNASVEADRVAAERDRARARLRRVGEYRDLVAQQRDGSEGSPDPARAVAAAARHRRPAAPAPAPWIARALAAAAALLLSMLVYVKSAPDPAASRELAAIVGAGFLAAAAGYVGVAARRTRRAATADALPADAAAARERPARAIGDEWRDALRHRFADLGDPDDPRLLPELRARLAALDAEFAPLAAALERLDEAVAAFDVDAGRAARVAHGALPSRIDAAEGFAHGETAADARGRVAKLGDAVCHAAVERDAILAGGTESVAAAADSVRAAFRALGEAAGDPAGAEAVLDRAGLAGGHPADVAALRGDEDLCVRLGQEVAAIGRARPGSARPAEERVATPRPAEPDAWSRAGADAAALIGDVVGAITGRQFVLVQAGADLEIRLQGPGDARPLGWPALGPDVRERIALALRLRRAEAALGDAAAKGAAEPRCVVLVDRPETFEDDDALERFVRSVAPRVAQVVVPAAARLGFRGAAAAWTSRAPAAQRDVTPR